MIVDRKKFFLGLVLLVLFFTVLVVMFLPVIDGGNALEYLDALFNSISKSSAYYMAEVGEEAASHDGAAVALTLDMGEAGPAADAARIFEALGASAVVTDSTIRVEGDLGAILKSCIADAEAMYHNRDEALSSKYGMKGRLALYTWWSILKEMDRDLKKQRKFDRAKVVTLVKNKAVEPSYNYFGIEPCRIADRLGVVLFALFFYVAYTLWYGFAILFLFEGWGMKLSH